MERRRKTRWSRFRGVCDQKGLSGRRCGFGLLITRDWLIIKKKEANMCTVNPDLNIFGFPQPTPDSLYPITCSLVVLETLLFSTPTLRITRLSSSTRHLHKIRHTKAMKEHHRHTTKFISASNPPLEAYKLTT